MSPFRFAVISIAASIPLAGLPGCGSSPPPSGPQAATDAPLREDASGEAEPASSKPRKKSAGKSSASNGKKSTKGKSKSAQDKSGPHIGEIPRDAWPEVFFDEPLTVYAEKGASQPVALQAAPDSKSAPEKVAGTPSSGASGNSVPTSSGDDWGALLTGEVLGDETKAIKSSLNDKLQSVGKYSGNYKELRVDAATLAIFASIANEFPDGPSWKPNAKYIRDAAAEIVRSASANGDKYYKPTRAAFDQLDALFSGSKPPGLEEASDSLPFSELVGRTPLMFRMERAFNYLKLNVNTEAAFKKESAKVIHEGAVLGALAKAIAAPTYEDADLDEYQKFARELQQCGISVAEAVKNNDYAAYTAALDRGSKACTDCHSNFKNN